MRRTWFVFGILAGLLVLAIVGAWRVHATNRDRAVRHYQEEQLATASVVAGILQSELTGAARSLATLAAALASEPDLHPSRHPLVDHVRCAHQPCFAAVAVYDEHGEIVDATGESLELTREERDEALRSTHDPADAEYIHRLMPSTGVPSVVLAARLPARASGAGTRGMVAAKVRFASLLTGQERSARAGYRRFTTLVLDGRGSVVFHSEHPEMRFNNIFRRSRVCDSCHQSFDHVERIFKMREGVLEYTLRGVPYLAAVAPLPFAGDAWRAAVMAPADRAVGVLTAEVRQLAFLMVALVAAVAIAGRVTWVANARRIEADTTAANKARLEQSHAALTAMNQQLEAAAIEWRMTVDTIDAAIVVLEPEGTIQRMNRAASDLLPGTPYAWLGRPSVEQAHLPPWDAALKLACQAVNRRVASTARVLYASTGRTWDWSCRTPRHGEGAVVVIVARDVTGVIELQESVRRSETMAALGSVVVGVAHEVRNPLFAISSIVDALAVQKRCASEAQFIGALRNEVARLKTLMTELLEYGTPSTSVLQPHSIRATLEEAVSACRLESESRWVRVVTSAPDDAQVWMDPRRLVRVFINLIQNALQHAPADSDVTVTLNSAAAKECSQIEVVVRDSGPGFAAEDLPRLFTPFFSRRAGGFGLGLAISERIVGEHRGRIVAGNNPAGGAVVSVVLPLAAPEGATQVTEGVESC
jgi:signal transduction histidine kinase